MPEANPTSSADPPTVPATAFGILMFYDNQGSAVRGLQLCNKQAETLGSEFTVQKAIWKLEWLNGSAICELACNEAAKANLIVISIERDFDLPLAVSERIEKVLSGTKNTPRALVALIKDQAARATENSTLLFLQKLAECQMLDFFTNADVKMLEPCASTMNGSGSANSETGGY